MWDAYGSPATYTYAKPGRYEIAIGVYTNVDLRVASRIFEVREPPGEVDQPTAETDQPSEEVEQPAGKSCDWKGGICLIGEERPLVGPQPLRFEVPAEADSLSGTWRQSSAFQSGALDGPRLVEQGSPDGTSVWEAVLPPGAEDGVLALDVAAYRGAEQIAGGHFGELPVLATATDFDARVSKRRRAYVATFAYTARRQVRAKTVSRLYGTKRSGKWRMLAKRKLTQSGTGATTHRQRFSKRHVRRKCHRYKPCRFVVAAVLTAEGYFVDGVVTFGAV